MKLGNKENKAPTKCIQLRLHSRKQTQGAISMRTHLVELKEQIQDLISSLDRTLEEMRVVAEQTQKQLQRIQLKQIQKLTGLDKQSEVRSLSAQLSNYLRAIELNQARLPVPIDALQLKLQQSKRAESSFKLCIQKARQKLTHLSKVNSILGRMKHDMPHQIDLIVCQNI